jgi:hypothetical protein
LTVCGAGAGARGEVRDYSDEEGAQGGDAGADYGEVDFDGGPVWRCEVSVFSRGWYWGGGRGGGESE